jgi:CRP-like cAMP-binding protein
MSPARTQAKSSGSHTSGGRTVQFRENRILTALPPEDLGRLTPHLIEMALGYKKSLSKARAPIREVCFPDSGVCSVMSVMRNGACAEIGTVGNEGVTGIALFFGDATEPSESLIQVPGRGRMLPADVFQRELARHGALYRLIGRYAHALMIQIMQTAACNALHPLEKRAAKWLLMTHDRVYSPEFTLTHEFFGLMLGASRPTVSIVAEQLHKAGYIEYHRGTVRILDREGLEASACECYAIVKGIFDKFLKDLDTVGAGATS